LKSQKFDVSIVLQTNWKISLALLLSGIPKRIGPLSKPYSFLVYNFGIRQKRSQVEMHEADYNLELTRKLKIQIKSRTIPTKIVVSDQEMINAKNWLLKQGYDFTKPLIMIHPGMGGSAMNWPETHYIDLIKHLVDENSALLVTAGPTEIQIIDHIKKALGSNRKDKVYYYISPSSDHLSFFTALCQHAKCIIAPSTGPLHMAVALNKKIVTFFSPIRVQSALRWGPYCEDESKISVLVPEVYCGQDFHCRGTLCNYFPCMKSITVKQAIEAVAFHMDSSE
jgi:ADP-heptose:LPS heptosyltransferase